MWIYLITLLLAYLLVKVVPVLLAYRRTVNMVRPFPTHPKEHWLFGLALEVNDLRSMLALLQAYVEENRPKAMVYWTLGIYPSINIVHPDLVKAALTAPAKDVHKNHGFGGTYRMLLPWLGDGLLVSNGQKWERNRKLLTPAFHFDILKQYVPVYNSVADIFLNIVLEQTADGRSVDICPLVSRATLDTMLRCSLSYTDRVQEEGEKHPYVKTVQQLTHILGRRMINPFVYPDFLYRLTADYKEFKRLCDYVHEFASKSIRRRRATLETDPDQLNKRHLDFLDILLTATDEEGSGLTDLEIRHEVDTFMFEGHDTTASALSWSLFALAKYPDIQERVRQEVLQVLDGRVVFDIGDLSRLPYLTCVVKETLRMYTTVPAISRKLTAPLVLDGVTLHPGTVLDIFFYLVHHNPDIWPDHMVFRPERFLSENPEKKDPFMFTPFSAGQRNCIGQQFAMNEMKVMLSRVVTRFRVAVDERKEVDINPDIVMRAANGIHLLFTEI